MSELDQAGHGVEVDQQRIDEHLENKMTRNERLKEYVDYIHEVEGVEGASVNTLIGMRCKLVTQDIADVLAENERMRDALEEIIAEANRHEVHDSYRLINIRNKVLNTLTTEDNT